MPTKKIAKPISKHKKIPIQEKNRVHAFVNHNDDRRKLFYLIGLITGIAVVIVGGIWLTYSQFAKHKELAKLQQKEEFLLDDLAAQGSPVQAKAAPMPSNSSSPTKPEKVLTIKENHDVEFGRTGPILHTTPLTKVEVSSDPLFRKMYVTGTTNEEGAFRITTPPFDLIYWRIKGQEEVHAIQIPRPEMTLVRLTSPATIALSGTVQWEARSSAGLYKFEFSENKNFQGAVKIISTRTKHVSARELGTGHFHIRVHALNLQTGAWETSAASVVDVEND